MQHRKQYFCPECERDLTPAVEMLGEMSFEIHKELHLRDRIRSVIIPFLDPKFREILGGNAQGLDSPLYARNGATLTIGDFQRLFEVFGEPGPLQKEPEPISDRSRLKDLLQVSLGLLEFWVSEEIQCEDDSIADHLEALKKEIKNLG